MQSMPSSRLMSSSESSAQESSSRLSQGIKTPGKNLKAEEGPVRSVRSSRLMFSGKSSAPEVQVSPARAGNEQPSKKFLGAERRPCGLDPSSGCGNETMRSRPIIRQLARRKQL